MNFFSKDVPKPSPSDQEMESASPVPENATLVLNFTEALNAILSGSKVTKEDWDDEDIYGFIDNDQLMLHRNNKDHQWVLSKGDIEGEDFFVIN